jgi:hypothetical protein
VVVGTHVLVVVGTTKVVDSVVEAVLIPELAEEVLLVTIDEETDPLVDSVVVGTDDVELWLEDDAVVQLVDVVANDDCDVVGTDVVAIVEETVEVVSEVIGQVLVVLCFVVVEE